MLLADAFCVVVSIIKFDGFIPIIEAGFPCRGVISCDFDVVNFVSVELWFYGEGKAIRVRFFS